MNSGPFKNCSVIVENHRMQKILQKSMADFSSEDDKCGVTLFFSVDDVKKIKRESRNKFYILIRSDEIYTKVRYSSNKLDPICSYDIQVTYKEGHLIIPSKIPCLNF